MSEQEVPTLTGKLVRQEFLKPKLNGDRFSEHSVPLELLQDFAALQEMLVETAKWEFFQAHPERKRVPRNFTDGIDLHLTSIEDGSAVLAISLVFASLFPSSANLPYFEKARTDIIEAIAAAEAGVPARLQPQQLYFFDRFGRSLRAGESISFSYEGREATLSPVTRDRLIQMSHATEWTEEITLRARINEVDKARKTFEIQLADGTNLKGVLNAPYVKPVLEAFDKYGLGDGELVSIQCVAKKDKSGLKGIEYIEHVTALDPLDISVRLEELALLADGWLDGRGSALSRSGLDWLSAKFEVSLNPAVRLPYLYPTAEGAVQAEWSMNNWEVSLLVDIDQKIGTYQALNMSNAQISELTLDLSEKEEWEKLNSQLLSIETAGPEVHSE